MVGTINWSIWSLIFSLAFTPVTVRAEPPKLPVPAVDQSALGQRGYFFVPPLSSTAHLNNRYEVTSFRFAPKMSVI
jgi:hypothetical protein